MPLPETVTKSLPAARLLPQETSAAAAVFLHDPSREKAILENPRLRSNESPSGAFKRQSGLR